MASYDGTYRIETFTFDDPVFVDVPVSYVITMQNSKRRASYLAQLRRYRPTATVHVVHNPGREHPNKPAWVNSTVRDLWHANRAVVHWTRHINAPVLILEDDVQFTDEFTRDSARRIEQFLRGAEPHAVYFLGCVPYLSRDGASHMRLFVGGASHAVLCTLAARKRMAIATPNIPHDLWYTLTLPCYAPRLPLAVQTHPVTNNMQCWDKTGFLRLALRFFRADTDGHRFYKGAHTWGRMSLPVSVGVVVVLATVLKF